MVNLYYLVKADSKAGSKVGTLCCRSTYGGSRCERAPLDAVSAAVLAGFDGGHDTCPDGGYRGAHDREDDHHLGRTRQVLI